MSRGDPDLDIRITQNHFNYFPNEEAKREHEVFEATHGKKAKRVTFNSGFKNKYQLNIDGTVAAYRLPALIAGNSVVLKQDSPYYEHFYRALKPWEHYIPVARNLSDLKPQLAWAKANDGLVEAMGRRARLLARHHLRIEDIFCYHILAFTRCVPFPNCRQRPCLDGPCLDGPCLDGPCLDGPCLDGPCLDGPCLDGPCRAKYENAVR
jgi:hypothetical protein